MEEKIQRILREVTSHVNASSNKKIVRKWFIEWSRYSFDNLFHKDKKWHQFDSNQDAPYFWEWINIEKMQIFSYVEWDLIFVEYIYRKNFNEEIKNRFENWPNVWIDSCSLEKDKQKDIDKYLLNLWIKNYGKKI